MTATNKCYNFVGFGYSPPLIVCTGLCTGFHLENCPRGGGGGGGAGNT